MWPFRQKQTLETCGFFQGFTDWHSHILPGVDDGVPTFQESLSILSRYEQLGIREVWLTPHIMEDVPNTPEQLRERFSQLQAAYSGPVQLHLAAENMLDALFEERLAQHDLLPIGMEGNCLLVETSYYNPPARLPQILQRIMQQGYYVLLAHPERYLYMTDKDYRQYRQMGVRFQLNLLSLAGYYGHQVQRRAEMLLRKQYYNCIGTDLHRIQQFTFITSRKIRIKYGIIENCSSRNRICGT